jgi:SNF2 family DNA or RNA helicase
MLRGSFEFFEYPTQSKDNASWWNNWEHSNTPLQRRVIIICYSTLVREYKAIFEATSADPIKAKLAQRKPYKTLSRTLYSLDPWLVAADEAHTAKNIKTAKFRAVHHVMWLAAIRIAITATPIHNQLEDMLNLIIMIQMKCTMNSQDSLHHKLIDGHLRKYLPILRSRARQHRLYCALEVPPDSSHDSNDAITVSQSHVLSEGIRFGKEFLIRAVRLITQLASRSMIRRKQSSVDWEEKPLLLLPTKIVTRHLINLTPQEQAWYIEENCAARAGKKNDLLVKTPVCKIPV